MRYSRAMPTLFLKGDLFNTEGLRALAVAAPLDGSMSQGVASAFAKRWPALAEAYRVHCTETKPQVGDVFTWQGDGHTVFVLGTQSRGDSKPKIPGLTRALRRMVELATQAGVERVGVPRLTTAAHGIDWRRVRRVFEEVSDGQPLLVEVFEQFVRQRAEGESSAADDAAADDMQG